MFFSIAEDKEKVRVRLFPIFTNGKTVLCLENGLEINRSIMERYSYAAEVTERLCIIRHHRLKAILRALFWKFRTVSGTVFGIETDKCAKDTPTGILICIKQSVI